MQIKKVIMVLLEWIRPRFLFNICGQTSGWVKVFVLTPRGRRGLRGGGCRPPCRSVGLDRSKHKHSVNDHNVKTIGSEDPAFSEQFGDLGTKARVQ